MTAIAKDLVGLFPVLGHPKEEDLGFEIWYYNTTGCSHASGYLYEKLQNQRRYFKTGKAIASAPGNSAESSGWTSDENGNLHFGLV